MTRVVLLTKTDRFSRSAQVFARAAFGDALTIAEGAVGDRRPNCLRDHGEHLISFLSPWIITAAELERFQSAINFHPGPVEYPGTGCYNFAIYEGAAEYGATCHHMLPAVDTGLVVRETRFPVPSDTSVEHLKLATMEAMLRMFEEIVTTIADGLPLPTASTHWTRPAFRKSQMEALRRVEPEMSHDEAERRVRASTYPGYPGAYMMRGGARYQFPVPDRPPLA